jgi:hypothetical protein
MRWLRRIGYSLLFLVPGVALANYAVTQGSGTNFGSVVISTVHYAAQLVCDFTTANQCAAVKAASTPAALTDPALVVQNAQEHIDLAAVNTSIQSPIPAGTNVIGFISNDPCSQATKLGAAINLTASGQVITGTAAKKTYICSLDLVSATAQNIALVEGTGVVCATNIFGLAGGTTAATGWNLAANGGLTKGSGNGTVYSPSADTNATAANVCVLLSSTGQTSGQITYVQQ